MVGGMEDTLDPEAAWKEWRVTVNLSDVAKHVGLTRAAVSYWKMVPAERLMEVSAFTGIPARRLRPDLYPRDPWSKL